MQTTDPCRIKPPPLFFLSLRVDVAPPGLTQTWLNLGTGYQGWMPPVAGCPVSRIFRQTARAALVQLAAALVLKVPASDLVLALMRLATKVMRALFLSWTRSLRTRTPVRTQCKARAWGRGELGRINPKLPLANHCGDPEMTGVGGAPSIIHGDSQHLAAETLSDHSPTHSLWRYGTQTPSATLQRPAEGMDDLTPAHTVPSALPTPPTSGDTCCATRESDFIRVSFVTRASSRPLSSLCTLAHTQASDLSDALSVVNVLPAVGTCEPTNGMFTWGRGRLHAQSVGRGLPTGGT